MGKFREVLGINQSQGCYLVNPTKLADYTIIRAHTMVTQATSHDIFLGGAILYPLGFILDYWEKNHLLPTKMVHIK